jgi:hypothetical protein
MPGGAPVDRRAPAAAVLGDVRAHVELAQLHHEVLGVVALVGPECHRPRPVAMGHDQVERGQPFGMARHPRQPGADDQAVAR